VTHIDVDTRAYMIANMRRFGGSFVQALGECFWRADDDNTKRLLLAFPEYVQLYTGEQWRNRPKETGNQP
jgi:hypothetical protein